MKTTATPPLDVAAAVLSLKTKVCTKCGRELTLDKFYHNPKGRFGVGSQCKECKNQYQRKYAMSKTKQLTPAPKSGITHNIELVNKQPRELITDMRNILNELISRGYEYKNGKLYYTQEIKLI